MLLAVLSVYLGCVIGLVIGTVFLIVFGYGWGPLPHLYIRLVHFLQSFYPHTFPPSEDVTWPALLERSRLSTLERHRNDSLASFKFSKRPMDGVFDACSDAFKAGFEAIIQDEISVAFESAPPFYTTLLERPGRLPFPDAPFPIGAQHMIGYLIAVCFRYGVLLPVRLSLICVAFIFSLGAALIASSSTLSSWIPLSNHHRAHISFIYSRLFCAGIGLVATYHHMENRPKQPGIAVANHLSPNDVQIICADGDRSYRDVYTITGQLHDGIIGILESIAEKVCPTVWLKRSDNLDRIRFMNKVLQIGRVEGPVLLFPEGYCTNNTRVLQFRRAVFDDDVVIHPIAIRQHARYGDSFWYEDQVWRYFLRVLTSWAIVYDVTYLTPQRKNSTESNQQFAERVQMAIARCANAECARFDGRLWYSVAEKQRVKDVQMNNLAKRIVENLARNNAKKRMRSPKKENKGKGDNEFMLQINTDSFINYRSEPLAGVILHQSSDWVK